MEHNTTHDSEPMLSHSDLELEEIVGDLYNHDDKARLSAALELEKRGKASERIRSIRSRIEARRQQQQQLAPAPAVATVNVFARGQVVARSLQGLQEEPDEEGMLLPYPTQDTLVLASGGKRLANLFIDTVAAIVFVVVIGITLGILASLFGFDHFLEEEDPILDRLLGYAAYILYYLLCEFALNGRTIGKMITRTRVLDENGNKPGLLKVLGRTLARLIPFEWFSFLGEDARGWHDTLSRTIVIDENKSILRSEWL